MTKPKTNEPFTCYLCIRAGRKTLAPRWKGRSRICRDCADSILVSGRAWCAKGLHIVEPNDVIGNYCGTCNRARQRRYPPPDGFTHANAVARRLHIHDSTLRYWLRAGWPVETRRVGIFLYVRDMARYPDPPMDRRRWNGGSRKRAA